MDTSMFGPEQAMPEFHLQKLAQGQANIESTQLDNLQKYQKISSAQADADRQRQYQGIMAQLGADRDWTKLPIASKLEAAADRAMQAGMTKEATDLIEAGTKIKAQLATQNYQESLAKKSQLDAMQKQVQAFSNVLGGVTNAEEWALANATIQQMTGQPSPYANEPYDPGLVKLLHESTLTAKDRIDLAIKQSDAESKDRNRRSLEDYREYRKTILDRDAKTREERTRVLGKVGGTSGGKDIKAPTKTEIEQAVSLLSTDDDAKDLPIEEMNQEAYRIAAEAKEISQRKKVNMSEAMAQAFDAAKRRSDFQTSVSANKKFLGMQVPMTGGKKETTIKGNMYNPLPVPKVASEFKVGRYYVNSNGQVGQVVRGAGGKLSIKLVGRNITPPKHPEPDVESAEEDIEEEEE